MQHRCNHFSCPKPTLISCRIYISGTTFKFCNIFHVDLEIIKFEDLEWIENIDNKNVFELLLEIFYIYFTVLRSAVKWKQNWPWQCKRCGFLELYISSNCIISTWMWSIHPGHVQANLLTAIKSSGYVRKHTGEDN